MNPIKNLWILAAPGDRTALFFLVLMIVINGLLEVFGIDLLLPYGTLLQEQDKIGENRYLSTIYHVLPFSSTRSFLMAASLILLSIFLAKAAFTLWMTNYQLRFINFKQTELGERLLAGYMSQPYAFFLANNTSKLIGNLTTTLNQLCSGVIQSGLTLLAEIIVLLGLVSFLLYLSAIFSALAFVFVALLANLFIRIVKPRIAGYAKENDQRWKGMIRVANESLSAAKEVQVLGRYAFFQLRYGHEARSFADAVRKYSILSQLSRASLETAAVGGMVLFSVFSLASGNDKTAPFAVLAVFAVATIRIVPSANRILQAWNAIGFYQPSLNIIASALTAARPVPNGAVNAPELHLSHTLSISVKSFYYPSNASFRLSNIDLRISRGETVAFIGSSGSGKSTLIDLILGLFPEFDGSIAVDGVEVRTNISSWRRRIGYIPQSIYMCDDTIAQNIAFGVSEHEIDFEQVRRAAKLAGLTQVVFTQPEGLETIIGERGIRLSGGERQRIGIARALYHDPDVLVMDEATSALDNETERQIADSILS
jgi:ATP-binding cassette, subfamily B, bacterial PglK